MQVTVHNDVKVYSLSAGKSTPGFEEEAYKNKTSLRYNDDYRKRIDLIQDFEFTIATSRVKVSADGQYIAATGVYPPEVKLFDARELGLKCSRGLDSEVVDFMFLSEDYKKLVFLMENRYLEFHAQYGRHHRIRVPKPGRTMCYDSTSCVLFVGGSTPEVMRIDLEAGIFHAPLATSRLEEVHQAVTSPMLPVLTCAGNHGIVESFDVRETSKPLQSLQICAPGEFAEDESHVTCCAYSANGMYFAAGTSGGLVRVYDIRSSRPLTERDHKNGYGIRSVQFHVRSIEDERLLVASADKRSVKVWDASNAAMQASMESPATINSMTFVPRSGLLFLANDQSRIGAYFIPSLGLAPKWCSFLDSLTEELEETKQKAVFDDYQFVTAEQLDNLGASELVGSKFLQPYMHGYFMDHRLYARLKSAMDPFAFEEYRKKRIRDKVEAKRTMRTRVKKVRGKAVNVNTGLHSKLQDAVGDGEFRGASKKRRDAGTKAKSLLEDNRFKELFEDPDFAISEKGIAGDAFSQAGPSLAELTAGSGGSKKKKPRFDKKK